MENIKIRTFFDLNAWQEGHKLVLMIYELVKTFPKEEIFRLTNQICRAAISITSNIAEGFSRNSAKEKQQFYATSLGSLSELQNQLLISKDLKYTSEDRYQQIFEQTVTVGRLLQGLMRSAQSRSFTHT